MTCLTMFHEAIYAPPANPLPSSCQWTLDVFLTRDRSFFELSNAIDSSPEASTWWCHPIYSIPYVGAGPSSSRHIRVCFGFSDNQTACLA
jgi:hypothetical protein